MPPCSLPLLILSANILVATHVVAAQPTCDCQPLGPPNDESYIITRLWNIVSDDWTDQGVIDEFNSGFAPLVTSLDGFQRYTAAATGNSSTVFFMNAFDSQEHAHVAQEAAKTFVTEGRLNGAITPNTFTEDKVLFNYAAEECVTEPEVGDYLATRVFKLSDPASATPESLSAAGASVSESFENLPGFVMWGGSVSVPDYESVFLFNIYDVESSAVTTQSIGLENDAKGNDPNITTTIPSATVSAVTQGKIAFDYLCAAGNSPGPTGEDDETSVPAGENGGGTSAADAVGGKKSMMIPVLVMAVLISRH